MKFSLLFKTLIFSTTLLLILGGCAGKKVETDLDVNNPTSTTNVQLPTLKYLGRASVKIKTSKGTVIYIDPYAGNDYVEPADIVLITHEHDDHNKLSLIKNASEAKVIRSKDSLDNGTYKSFQEKDVKIEAFAAYNKNHKKEEGVGYILEFDGLKLYHAGDTSKIEEMNSLASKNIDYALLPIDGVYNMDALEAMECAEIIKAKYNVPMHSSGSDNFSKDNVDKYKPQNVIPIQLEDVITLEASPKQK